MSRAEITTPEVLVEASAVEYSRPPQRLAEFTGQPAAMEEYKVDIRLGDGPKAQIVTIDIQPFTLVGATTRLGMLTPPMRARFGIEQRLNYYPPEDLETIVRRTAEVLKVTLEDGGAT